MNADPFRPLPAQDDYAVDLARIVGGDLDEDEQAHIEEMAEPTGIVWLVIVAALASLGIGAWFAGAL